MPGQRREVEKRYEAEAACAAESCREGRYGVGFKCVSPGSFSIGRIQLYQRGNGLSANLQYRARSGERSFWEARVNRASGMEKVLPSKRSP